MYNEERDCEKICETIRRAGNTTAKEYDRRLNEWSDDRNKLITTTNIGDYVAYKTESSSRLNGYVKLVTIKGVNVSTPWGDRFIKWKNVIETSKNVQHVIPVNPKEIKLNLSLIINSEFEHKHTELRIVNKILDVDDLHRIINNSSETILTLDNGDTYKIK